ncbi:metallophosphoesterase family protein [Derxia lacustris]|uniref:metallophosphoesterase family protein n=1 Tax=Derxia lacustris TaxID=764842 RepID=UPI000A17544D|nr:DNA repair exonuclease [Derxia lacustris]
MFRFLHAADLHLDSPLRGLDRYDGAPVDRLRNATRDAFRRLVDLAIAERVAFVLLAGDLYDGDWTDFHTGLFLRGELVRLGQAGIRVFIVRGNHDARSVITRELELPGNVHEFSVRKPDTVLLDAHPVAIHGQSFADRAMPDDLVPGYPAAVPGRFNIGLLHTSLAGSPEHDSYAPTTLATLRQRGYDYWALGHVHARQRASEAPWVVFPGNLQGRHARETGAKGCELVTVDDGFGVTSEFMPLDVVRWTALDIDLGPDGPAPAADLAAAQARVRAALDATVRAAPDRLHAVRITLAGQSPLALDEARMPGTLAAAVRAAAQDVDAGEVWIERIAVALRAPFDRAAEAARDDAVGELVRSVDALGADPEALAALVAPLLDALRKQLPDGLLTDAERAALHDPGDWQALLHEAEDTVLARLAGEVRA